jgi:hypothetical protein
MESHGAQVECQGAFSRIEKWKASAGEGHLRLCQADKEGKGRLQIAAEEAMAMRIWTTMDPTDIGINQTA